MNWKYTYISVKMSARFSMVLPVSTLILPFVGDSIMAQFLCQLHDKRGKVARRLWAQIMTCWAMLLSVSS
jgi:hypothetical protein